MTRFRRIQSEQKERPIVPSVAVDNHQRPVALQPTQYGTIMSMDVPVFAQATVDQTDEFSRKLSVYARGQIGRLDYRLVLSDPFPVNTNGSLGTDGDRRNRNSCCHYHHQ